MNIIVSESFEKMSDAAAMAVSAHIMTKPDCSLGLSADQPLLEAYARIVRIHREGLLDFKWIRAFAAAERAGMGKDSPGGCRAALWEHFLSKINIDEKNIFSPDGAADNIDRECLLYTERLEAEGGIDLMLLSLGENGRVAFIEPGECFEPATHVSAPQRSGIAGRMVLAADSGTLLPPARGAALTIGVGAIMKARRVILVAAGERVADAVNALAYGKPAPGFPASILQFHGDVTVITDREAGSSL
ncbi:MAG: glucosamine-6-phosphate deaminase [Clostridiales bacterium]|jgi:glucosamine-6-phosphate deaminase|nr:glucosamine-6-phosphate deaminase [Clostridiales bacterium]